MNFFKLIMLLSLILNSSLILGYNADADTLSDNEAKIIIENLWNQPDVGLMLGDVKFVEKEPDFTKRQDILKELPLYKAFEQKGVIRITNKKDLTKNSGGWNDWFALTQTGVRQELTVSLINQGENIGTVKRYGTIDVLLIKVANYKIEEIVANSPEIIGAEKYRVVMGTYICDIPEDLISAWGSTRRWATRESRFKVLLKYDPFEKQWKIITQDLSSRIEDFKTNNVSSTLQLLKAGLK